MEQVAVHINRTAASKTTNEKEETRQTESIPGVAHSAHHVEL